MKPECDIYVINIKDSEKRREHIVSQLEALGLAYRIFPAVDGKITTHALFEKYNEGKRISLKGKTLAGGQLGCYASHYLLWEECVRKNQPIIVLEDDARFFPDHFMAFYHNAGALDKRFECVRLFESYGKKRRGRQVGELAHIKLFKYAKGYMGTIGYYLTPSGAKKFLEGSQEWFLTVDIFMDRFWANGVEYYGVVPACLDFDPKFSSDIDYTQGRVKRSLKTRIYRELFSISEAFRRMLWNLRFMLCRFLRRV